MKANGLDQSKAIYTLLLDMNNICKISLVDKSIGSDGAEYGMISTALRIVGNVLRKKDFDYCVAAWDGEGSGIMRWELYSDYKANRGKKYALFGGDNDYDRSMREFVKVVIGRRERKNSMGETDDESFARQKPILQSMFEELCIRQYEYERVEGDDIIANYVKNRLDNEKVVIVSSDRDIAQLISENVIIYNPRIRDFITVSNCVEKLGIRSDNIVLDKVICGDASDNIKGVKGVGSTTLAKYFPEIRTRKLTLEEVVSDARKINEERKNAKKRPLQALTNIADGITDGVQGDSLYKVNMAIIDLSEPLLTDSARKDMEETVRGVMDTSDRNVRNVYEIAKENNIVSLTNEDRFGEVIGNYSRIVMMENKRYKENKI